MVMCVKDLSSAQPRYLAIAQELRRRISAGTYPPGGQLPSEAALCSEFGTSRGPVRQAVDSLRQAGLVSVSRGAPPRVLAVTAPTHPFESLVSFTEWAQSVDRVPGQRTIELRRVIGDTQVASRLELALGAAVIEIIRVRSLDGAPAMVERSHFVPDAGRWLFEPDFDPDAGSVYHQLRDCGVDLYRGQHVIDALAADDVDSELLDVAVGSPLLRVRRTVTSKDGRPLEVADDRYRPGVAAISMTNTAGTPASIFQLTPGKVSS